MRTVKLQFVDGGQLDQLLSDDSFMKDIYYLSPHRLNAKNIVLFDPVTAHSPLDTEIVVLSKFAQGVKRVLFADSGFNVEFLNPIVNEQKGGLVHNGERIIDSTDVERLSIVVSVANA